jgi:hypothetical protein
MKRRYFSLLLLIFVLAGCSYQETVRHYTGSSLRSNNYVTNGQGTVWEPVEATYHESRNSGILLTHFLQTDHRDTFLFYPTDSNCRWAKNPARDSEIRWSDPTLGWAKIFRTSDSLTVFRSSDFGDEAFFLKQDSEWVAPVYTKTRIGFLGLHILN